MRAMILPSLFALVPFFTGCLSAPGTGTGTGTGSSGGQVHAPAPGSDAPPTGSDGSDDGGSGFGTDLIFDNLLATPNLIARTACPDFHIAAGDFLQIFAEEDGLEIDSADGTDVFGVPVPADGYYVWEGQSPNRITNELVSNQLQVDATMDPDTADVTIIRLEPGSTGCVLARCASFGPCE